jgi:1,4-dihydroxy-2-naphthoate polyprenyltransferase
MDLNNFLKIMKLGRFQFIAGGFLSFSIGALLAILFNAEFNLSKFLLGYSILFTAQLSVSYSNDYFDINVDRHSQSTGFSGGSGILLDNSQLREFSKWFSIALISISILLGTVFIIIFQFPWYFLLLVLFGNLLGWYYSAPPLKLAYRGLSEVSTVLTGFIVPGMGYIILMGKLDFNFLFFAVPLMIYEFFFIINIEIPDMEADRLGGKRNLITKKGRAFGFTITILSAFLGTISILLLQLTSIYPAFLDFRLIALFSLIPLFIGIWSFLEKGEDKEKNSVLNLVKRNISSLFLFIILVNCYFLYLSYSHIIY